MQNAGCPLVATAHFLKKWAINGVITKLYCAANEVQHQAQNNYRSRWLKVTPCGILVTHKRNLPPLCLTLLL